MNEDGHKLMVQLYLHCKSNSKKEKNSEEMKIIFI